MSQRIKDIIISSVISIAITIVFGYYFLYIGTIQREPTFYVDPIRTTVIDQHNVEGAPLLLLKSNGDTISSDVVSVYFYFFNQGKETIKRENVYAPLKIKVDKATVLDYKILKSSRAVSGASLTLDTISNKLNIDFNALEKGDGIAGQIIFEGDKNATLVLEGGIDGVTEFATELNAIPPIWFLIAIFLFLIAAYIFLIMNKRTPRPVPKLLFFFSALPVIYLLLMFYKSEWFVHHKVPQALRGEQYIEKQEQQVLDLPAWLK
jgi:hypothetical protein